MKKILLSISILISCVLIQSAQSISNEWVMATGGPGIEAGYSITVDPMGNSISSGLYNSTVDFDPGAGTSILSTGGGHSDAYILKLDPDKNFIWVKPLVASGVSDMVISLSMKADNVGNIYCTGVYYGTVDFDPGPGVFNCTSASSSSYDIFVLKLTSAGNFDWVKSFGDVGNDYTSSVELDGAANVYIAGAFSGTVDFDPGPGVYNQIETSFFWMHTDGFLLKLDSAGNFIYARQFTGPDPETSQGVTKTKIDNLNNVILAIGFEDTLDADPNPSVFSIPNVGYGGGFAIAKLDASANLIWARGIADTTDIYGIDIDFDNNIYCSGLYNGLVDFDPGLGNYNMVDFADYSTFFLKLNSSGNFIWANSISTGYPPPNGWARIALDDIGYIYSSGAFVGTVDFDPGIGLTNLTTSGSQDIYILKLDTSGVLQTAKQIGGNDEDWIDDLVLSGDSNIYITGGFKGNVDFDPGAGNLNISSNGSFDLFVQKLNPCNSSSNTIFLNSCNPIVVNSEMYNTTGIYTQVLTSHTGCDSVLIIDATINNSSYSNIVVTACDSFNSPSGSHLWNFSGVYNDTIPNFEGCDSIITIDLTISTIDTNVYQSGTELWSASSGDSFQWYNCDSSLSIILGETNAFITPSQNGGYAVVVSYNGCIDTSVCYAINNVGISEIKNLQVLLFPNPVENILYIETINALYDSYEIISAEGKIIRSGALSQSTDNKFMIDVYTLRNGIFILKLFNSAEFINMKFIRN